MEKVSPDIEEVINDIKDYVTTSVDLYKLQATEKGAEIASTAIINIVLGVFAVIALQFASLALAFGLGIILGKTYLGFLVVAGLYAFIGIIIILTKDKLLKTTLVDSIIKSVYHSQK